MPRRKYASVPLVRIRQILKGAILDSSPRIGAKRNITSSIEDSISDLSVTSRKNLGIQENERKSTNMIFFVMYDIEDDKVRTQVSKYLLHEGCQRVQKSIFLADLSFEKMDKIMQDLTEVQACYENKDSIIILPVASDYLKAMRTIGKKIDIKFIMKAQNTVFF